MQLPVRETIADRVRLVLSNMQRAAARTGRDAHSVRLVAATKTVSADRIREGLQSGLILLGENRLQEAVPKIEALKGTPARWHFIGNVQRRKVRLMVGLFDLIHSVDSVELAQEIDRRAREAGHRQEILLEVNVGRERTKSGFEPDRLPDAVAKIAGLAHVHVKGLMAIPPPTDDPENARPYFRLLRDLARGIDDLKLPSISMEELSMGMSNDYEIAIEEGATLVRVGTAIFGARHA